MNDRTRRDMSGSIMARMSTHEPSALTKQFPIPGLSFDRGPGGLTRAHLSNVFGSASVFLHGAHVSHWQPTGHEPALFQSESSYYEPGKPIRGGVPICWPWFGPRDGGDAQSPPHGLARLRPWDLSSVELNADGALSLHLSLAPDERSRSVWPHDFELKFCVTLGSKLSMSLSTHNLDGAPLVITDALHTYFKVGDVRQVSVRGLKGVTYVSKVESVRKADAEEVIRFAGETDRVYVNTTATTVIEDPSMHRRITIAKEGSNSTVVWNPWIAKAKAMPDFGDEEWPAMVCVETANALDNAVQVPAHGSHTTTAHLSVERT